MNKQYNLPIYVRNKELQRNQETVVINQKSRKILKKLAQLNIITDLVLKRNTASFSCSNLESLKIMKVPLNVNVKNLSLIKRVQLESDPYQDCLITSPINKGSLLTIKQCKDNHTGGFLILKYRKKFLD